MITKIILNHWLRLISFIEFIGTQRRIAFSEQDFLDTNYRIKIQTSIEYINTWTKYFFYVKEYVKTDKFICCQLFLLTYYIFLFNMWIGNLKCLMSPDHLNIFLEIRGGYCCFLRVYHDTDTRNLRDLVQLIVGLIVKWI